jgi:hypothetical protein
MSHRVWSPASGPRSENGPTGARCDAEQGIAVGIQDWRPSTQRCHPRHNCKDPAANAAFSWEADTIGKVAGTVIVAANHHQRMDAAGPFARDHAHAGFSAIVRQIEARARQLATTHGDGALMKIGPASHLRPVCEITVCPHVVGKPGCESPSPSRNGPPPDQSRWPHRRRGSA